MFGIHHLRVYWYINVQQVACPSATPIGATWEHIQTTAPPDQPEAFMDSALDYLLSVHEDSTFLPAWVP